MAETPTPRSYNQILGDQIDAFLSRYGLKALKTGTPILSMLEATAQSQLRSSEDIFTLLEAQSLDQASGIALDRIGADESLARITEGPASGLVTVSDTSFSKISSKVFQGTAAPIIGSTKINVLDAILFPPTGSVYVGRGTNNFEGPISYTSILPPGSGGGESGGSYYSLVLASGTLRFHNLGETVVVAQGGDRTINAGSTLQTPQGNAVSAVQFRTLFLARIPDGETTIEGVQVIALKPGIIGNVSAGSIKSFSPTPFDGAAVTNPLPFTNGLAAEDDTTYRERIRAARQSRAKGTPLALQTAAIGVTSSDENKRVLSASVVSQSGLATILYIDDGTGYEERDEGIAIESLTDSASGGETYFRVSALRPVAKAFVLTSFVAPYTLTAGAKLSALVGGVLSEHTFDTDEFISIGNASAFEVAASINSNASLLWSARTYNNGTQVAIFAKSDSNESIQVVNPANDINDANIALGFSSTRVDTMRLYKNDRLLSKDGSLASIESNPTSFWLSLTGTQTLVIEVDGNKLSFNDAQFAAFTGQDFIDADTGFTTLGPNSPTAWAKVLTYRIPGITASAVAGKIIITSNRGRSSTASVAIVSGSLVSNAMFTVTSSTGKSNDYMLDRNTGELRLTSSLLVNDRLTAGSTSTRAFLESDVITPITLTSPNLWFGVDSAAKQILSGLTSSTPLSLSVVHGEVESWGSRARVTSVTSVPLFSNLLPGDWAVFWDSSSTTGIGQYRISSVDPSFKFFEMDMKQLSTGRYAHRIVQLNSGAFLVVGGFTGPIVYPNDGSSDIPTLASSSCEIYDPATGACTTAASMSVPRAWHTATKLSDGRVLVTGGMDDTFGVKDSCEIYDPNTNSWTSVASLAIGRCHHEAVLLNNNDVLVVGGTTALPDTVTTSTATYNVGGNAWTAQGNLNHARRHFALAKFSTTGNVTVAGGEDSGPTVTATLERYVAGVWTNIGNLNGGARRSLRAVAVSGTIVVFTGGSTSNSHLVDVPVTFTERYTDGGAITAGTVMNFARARHGMCNLTGTNIAVFGGIVPSVTSQSGRPEMYNGAWNNLANPLGTDNDLYGANRFGNFIAAVPTTADFFSIGGMTEKGPWSYASVETHLDGSDTWKVRSPLVTASMTLAQLGLQFVRANAELEHVTLSTASNYTADTIAAALASRLVGATPSVYRTTTLRVRTNTFNDIGVGSVLSGDIGLLAADVYGQAISLPVGDAIANLTGHMASLESGGSEVGTPDFHQSFLIASRDVNSVQYSWSLDTNSHNLFDQGDYTIGNMVSGLRSLDDQLVAVVGGYPVATRFSGIEGFSSAIENNRNSPYVSDSLLTLRDGHEMGWLPEDRFYFAAPYQLSYDDKLTVLVDGDVEQKRFTIPMWRSLKTTNSTYGATNTFKDGDNAGLTLATAFGYTGGPIDPFKFEDFAVFMPARQIPYVDVSALQDLLFRYYRLGPDGNSARLRYTYPDAESSGVVVKTNPVSSFNGVDNNARTDIDIVLASGALRAGYGINSFTTIGEVRPAAGTNLATVFYIFAYPIASASRTANVTTVTVTLPAGVTDHGLNTGDTIHLVSTSGSFTTADYVITDIDGTHFSYVDGAAGVPADIGPTANIGRAYLGAGQTGDISGAGVQQDDFFNLGVSASTDSTYEGFTTRIINDPSSNPYWIEGRQVWHTSIVTGSTPSFYTLGDSTAFKIFANQKQQAIAIAAAVNAQVGSPVTATTLNAATGVIYKSTADMISNGLYRDPLVDGLNYVQITTPPGSSVGDYQLTFKNPVSSSIVNADWTNETVRIVPRTAKNVVDWLNSGGVSGLYTVAAVERSSRGHKVQISSLTAGSGGSVQVQGGTANGATAPVIGSASIIGITSQTTYSQIAAADAQGFYASQYVAIDNTIALPKSAFTSATTLNYIAPINNQGQIGVGVTQTFTLRTAKTAGAVLRVEKQGQFLCFTNTYFGTALDTTGVHEGDWVNITTVLGTAAFPSDQINATNQGIYRVVRVVKAGVSFGTAITADGGISASFWVENVNGVEQGAAECDVQFFTPDSMMPGDDVFISSNLWGAGNRGSWKVTSVGSKATVCVAGTLVRAAGTVTVTVDGGTASNDMGLAANDYFDLFPGETDFPAGRYKVVSAPGAFSITYANAGPDATSVGTETIVGVPFQDAFTFTVEQSPNHVIQENEVGAAALGTESSLFQCIEGKAGRYIKQIQSIAPNSTDITLADIKFNTADRASQIGEAGGSIISALDKLNFSTALAQGLDGYRHSIGLIGEVNKVIYGDPDDPATYPGVAAAGATVNIQGPLVKRIEISLGIRVRSGAPKDDIEARIKSAVAATVNAAGVGQSIAITAITSAVQKVPGVVSVVPINPVLVTGNDLIVVQAYEKPLVLNLDQDIQISFIGD